MGPYPPRARPSRVERLGRAETNVARLKKDLLESNARGSSSSALEATSRALRGPGGGGSSGGVGDPGEDDRGEE